MKSEIEKEVQKTMESLDHVKQADPGPYFYSRLKTRMEPSSQTSMPFYWKLAFGLLLFLNLGSYWILGDSRTISADEDVNTLSEEYFDYTINYDELLSLEETGL